MKRKNSAGAEAAGVSLSGATAEKFASLLMDVIQMRRMRRRTPMIITTTIMALSLIIASFSKRQNVSAGLMIMTDANVAGA